MNIRHNKLLYLLSVSLLALFMTLSLPITSINMGSNEAMEREAYETEQIIRTYKVAVRLNPAHSSKMTGEKTSNHLFVLPLAVSLIVTASWAQFRPLVNLLLKRKLLLPIKFTSKYVA
ncbi:hypothetical protein FHR92_003612 [Fontibacillus solani]|uniref:Uncharacterized protein n=1 Tax=Fontibacillus solani TaxID=1572857 RepID=A0A7W3SVQ6_9BACL|nr:hypothetical protein [Fontibacillus solani]MBA9087131.1 hypothetical protein [Fontibacillus solani]